MGDPDRLEQLLAKLVSNAIKRSLPGVTAEVPNVGRFPCMALPLMIPVKLGAP